MMKKGKRKSLLHAKEKKKNFKQMKLEFECEKKVNNHTKSKRKRKHNNNTTCSSLCSLCSFFVFLSHIMFFFFKVACLFSGNFSFQIIIILLFKL